MTSVMLDLETLGNTPGSVIMSIGAVKFDLVRGITESFYRRVDLESCVAIGMHMDVSTVMWWLQQDEAARLEFAYIGGPLPAVLDGFASWLKDPDVEVWGNGAAFNNVLLSEAYRLAGIERPWKFWNDRCYRTLKSLHPDVPFIPPETAHNALGDARAQAEHLLTILRT